MTAGVPMIQTQDLPVRNFIYRTLALTEQAPTIEDAAQALNVSPEEMQRAYRRLDEAHAILLHADGRGIRMANPFSGVPTPFRVTSCDRTWNANCIWDSFGILACLNRDGRIVTPCPDCGDGIRLTFQNRTVGGDEGVVHFSLPFRHWYDDLVET